MVAPDLSGLSNLPNLPVSPQPAPDASAPPVLGAVEATTQEVQSTLDQVANLLQDTVEALHQATTELSTLVGTTTSPGSPVELPPPNSGQAGSAPPAASGSEGAGAPPGTTPGSASGTSAVVPSSDPSTGTSIATAAVADPSVQVSGEPLPHAASNEGEAAIPNPLPHSADQAQPPLGQGVTPSQAKGAEQAETENSQTQFLVEHLVAHVSQNPGLAGNSQALAQSRKAFEEFIVNVSQTGGDVSQGAKTGSYFSGFGTLSTMVLTALNSNTTADPRAPHMLPSGGPAAVAVLMIMKTLSDGDPNLMAALLGALMLANTVPYKAANETLKDQKTDQEELTLEFAKRYAEEMIKLTSDPAYSTYLGALVAIHMSEQVPPERLQQWVNVLKIGLLLTAVALLYQSEMGGGTAEEIVGCLRPGREIEEPDLKGTVLRQIKGYLDTLAPNQKEAVLMGMMEYLGSKPDLQSITDPIKVMQGMQAAKSFVPSQIQLASGA